jgi:hypothetical protein
MHSTWKYRWGGVLGGFSFKGVLGVGTKSRGPRFLCFMTTFFKPYDPMPRGLSPGALNHELTALPTNEAWKNINLIPKSYLFFPSKNNLQLLTNLFFPLEWKFAIAEWFGAVAVRGAAEGVVFGATPASHVTLKIKIIKT